MPFWEADPGGLPPRSWATRRSASVLARVADMARAAEVFILKAGSVAAAGQAGIGAPAGAVEIRGSAR